MYFSVFKSTVEQKLSGTKIIDQATCYGYLIQETVDGSILVNRVGSQYHSIDEAIQSIKDEHICNTIQKQIQHESYCQVSTSKIVSMIKRHHGNVKVTDTLIESYVELASSKLFTTDGVVQDLRKYNKLDSVIEGHVDYTLDDGSRVVISEDTQNKINKIFGQHQDVVQYMRLSVDNFLSVVNQLED